MKLLARINCKYMIETAFNYTQAPYFSILDLGIDHRHLIYTYPSYKSSHNVTHMDLDFSGTDITSFVG